MVDAARVKKALGGTIPALDGLRGLAILLVLAHNFNPFDGATSLPRKLVDIVMNAGWVGVQLFFVLSGFLITGILIDTKPARNGYRAFFGRRLVRIFPLYYVSLFVALVVLPRLSLPASLAAGREHQIYLWTYVSNWVQPFGMTVALVPHFWSLAVEEQFYLVWPFVVRGLSARRLLQVAVALLIVGLASRLAVRGALGNEEAAYMWTVCRVDALSFGALAAIAVRNPSMLAWLVARERVLLVASLAGLLILFGVTKGLPRVSFLEESLGYTALALCFAGWLLAAVVRHVRADGAGGVLTLRPLREVGKYSYGMYVFHLPLHLLAGQRLLGGSVSDASLPVGLGYFAGATLATFAAAFVSYHLLERHFLQLKRYFVAEAPRATPR